MRLIDTVLDLYLVVVLIRVIMSWVDFGRNQFTDIIYKLTEPVLAPIRNVLPSTGGIDFSPFVLMLGIYLLRRILFGM